MTDEDAADDAAVDDGAGGAPDPPRGPSPRRWGQVLRDPRALWFAAGLVVGLVATLVATSVVPAALDDANALEKGTIVVLSGRDQSIGTQRTALIAQWNALHPATKAEIVELPANTDAQRSEMLARAQAGGGGVDVYNLDVTSTAEFAAAGHLLSLDDSRVRPDDFLPGPLSTCYYDGTLYALPFNADVGLLYYNRALLGRLGRVVPPTNWGGLVDDAERTARETGGDVTGYLGQFGDYEGLTVTALEMVWGANGVVVDDDGAVLPDPRDVGAVRTAFSQLAAVAPGLPAGDENSTVDAFRRGKALYMRNWPLADRALHDPEQGPVIDFGVVPLPPGSAALGGQDLAVSATTRMPKAATALVEFLTDARSQQLLLQRGGLPATRRVVYADPEVRVDDPAVRSEDFIATVETALQGARPRPQVPHYAAFSRAFRVEVDASVRGRHEIVDEDLRDHLTAALEGRMPQPD